MMQVEEELMLVVGGNFNPASVGPEAYEKLVDKIRAQPAPYLEALRTRYLGDRFNAIEHADLHLGVPLRILEDVQPDEVSSIVNSLLRLYDAVLIMFDRIGDRDVLDTVVDEDTVNLLYRLNTKRLELRPLADRPAGDTPGDGT